MYINIILRNLDPIVERKRKKMANVINHEVNQYHNVWYGYGGSA